MPSQSESSFGNRLANASKLKEYVNNFSIAYAPPLPELSLANLTSQITDLTAVNQSVAENFQNYSVVVDNRSKLFRKTDTSVEKILSKIFNAVKALKGSEAQETKAVSAYITKMRSVKLKKTTVPNNSTPDPTDTVEKKGISQNELSYGSITQNFSDMLEVINSFGPAYNPAADNIKLPALQILLTTLQSTNNAVASTYAALQMQRKDREIKYIQLADVCQRIKYAVKSQYGNSSQEYNLVKALRF